MKNSYKCENAMKRINILRKQLIGNRCLNAKKRTEPSDDDVVIVAAVRTPLTKSGKGGLKDTLPEVMTGQVMAELVKRGKIKPEHVQDIVFGNVLQNGSGFMSARMSQFLGGFPETTSLMTVNRLCSSGLQAVMNAAYSISSKQVDIAIGGGVESMSLFDMNSLVVGE